MKAFLGLVLALITIPVGTTVLAGTPKAEAGGSRLHRPAIVMPEILITGKVMRPELTVVMKRNRIVYERGPADEFRPLDRIVESVTE